MSTNVSNELNKSVSDTFSKVDTDNKLSDTEASETDLIADDPKSKLVIESSRNRQIKYGPYEKVVTNIIFSSKIISLNCLGNKKFVSLNPDRQLCANKFKIDSQAESFEILYLSGGLIALLSKEKNKIVTAENEAKETLVANRPVVFGTWEVFELYDYPNGCVAFKSLANEKFVSARNKRSVANLVANRKEVEGGYELFKIQNYLSI